jgi:hypothetical protein
VNIDLSKHSQMSDKAFGFTCPTTAIQMADTIKATFQYGDCAIDFPDYSVVAYVEQIAGNTGQYDEATQNLVKAIAAYSHYAQIYLDENNDSWQSGDQYAEMATCYATTYDTEGITGALNDYRVDKKFDDNDMMATMSLGLDSATSVKAYFQKANKDPFTEDEAAAFTAEFAQGKEPIIHWKAMVGFLCS